MCARDHTAPSAAGKRTQSTKCNASRARGARAPARHERWCGHAADLHTQDCCAERRQAPAAGLTASAGRALWRAGLLNDLRRLDLAKLAWTLCASAGGGAVPSPRRRHGMAAAGGLLYLHGGDDGSNGELVYSPFSVVVDTH